MIANKVAVGSRTQEDRSASTRKALLEAGRAAILELGYSRTTVAEVSKRAGVSRGAQIHHYPTKQGLMLAVADFILTDTEREITELVQRIGEAAGLADDTDQALYTFVSEVWHRAFRDDKFHAILELINAARTDAVLHELLAERWQRLLSAYDGISAHALGATGLGGGSMPTLLNLTLCLIRGMATQHIVYSSSPDYYESLLRAWVSLVKDAVHRGWKDPAQ